MAEVLLVDDDADIRSMLVFILEEHGFVLREAGDGLDALEALAEHPPDVMVLDVMMPRLDGFGVLAEMAARDLAPHTRVLVLSAKADDRSVVKGYELRADEYLTKPFDPDRLASLVVRLASVPRGV
jgi:DNA-binding response OmpR family regulator